MAELGQQRQGGCVGHRQVQDDSAVIVGLSMMLFRWDLLGLPLFSLGAACTVLAAAFTLISMFSYLKAAWPELKRH